MNSPASFQPNSERRPLPLVGRTPLLVLLVLVGLAALVPSAATLHAETTSASGAQAITSIPWTITSPGTYYLASDLTLTADTSYAINIPIPNVTLDLNGHTISQTSGTNNSTIGVYVGADNVVVRNGNIANCLYGVYASANNGEFEDLFIVAETYMGMSVGGNNNTVRRCRINNVGGETVPNLAPYAIGIALSGSDALVVDCDVTTLTPGPGAYTVCILVNAQNALVVNNRFCAALKSLECYSGTTGKMRDNISVDVNYPYNASTPILTDEGNNQ